MDFVETEGDTIDAAIENALKLLGVGREKITVDIISEGRKGILGFGAQKAQDSRRAAKIAARCSKDCRAGAGRQRGAGCCAVDSVRGRRKSQSRLLEDILDLMGVKATVEQRASAGRR